MAINYEDIEDIFNHKKNCYQRKVFWNITDINKLLFKYNITHTSKYTLCNANTENSKSIFQYLRKLNHRENILHQYKMNISINKIPPNLPKLFYDNIQVLAEKKLYPHFNVS